MSETTRTYPRRVTCGDAQVEIARMTRADREALVAFIAALPAYDLLFVRRDLRHPKVVDAWMRTLESGEVESLVARHAGTMVGCTAPLIGRVGSRDKEEVVLPGGHVSIAAGANAVKRMWPKLDSWLEGRST